MILLNFATTIKGSSKHKDHVDWIEVGSVQFGVGRGVTTTGGGTDRDTTTPSFSEVSFSKPTDTASADLFFQAICGKSLGKAQIHFIQTGGTAATTQPYLKVTLDEALISGYSVSSGGERPSENFSVNFTKISFQFDTFDGGKVSTGTPKGWDLETMVEWAG